MAGGELRRSYTQMDFSLNRVNVRPHLPQGIFQQAQLQVRDPRRRYSAMPAANGKKHPTLDIYRPPSEYLPLSHSSQHASRSSRGQSVRLEGRNSMAATQSLNVHAPEFQMNKIHPSKSASNVGMMNGYGMMPHHTLQGKGPMMHTSRVTMPPMMHPLQTSKSSGNVLHTLPNMVVPQQAQMQQRVVHFKEEESVAAAMAQSSRPGACSLKRSKSLSSASEAAFQAQPGNHLNGAVLGSFSPDIKKDLDQAIKDPNVMTTRALMTLAKAIVERACSDRHVAQPAAEVCIGIIQNEKKETFLESLLNTCQLSYQERDKVLRAAGSADSRYCPYMKFLNEMFVQLKKSQMEMKTQYDGVPPKILMLTLLSKCLVDCLNAKRVSTLEIETIYFILTHTGKYVEQELPKAMDTIYTIMRDLFLKAPAASPIKKTLLQLIELRAAKWQMGAAAFSYYCQASRK